MLNHTIVAMFDGHRRTHVTEQLMGKIEFVAKEIIIVHRIMMGDDPLFGVCQLYERARI
jgi:hypothetical protein